MSDLPFWLIWPAGISLWLLLGWATFAYFEYKGMENKHESVVGYMTLSYFTWRVTQAFPPAIFLMGLGIGLFWGGLMVHFWWHWCPAGSVSIG